MAEEKQNIQSIDTPNTVANTLKRYTEKVVKPKIDNAVTDASKPLLVRKTIKEEKVAYQRDIPNVCLENSGNVLNYGGMSEKSKNLIPFPYADMPSGTGAVEKNGITWSVDNNGIITVNGIKDEGSVNNNFTMNNKLSYRDLGLNTGDYITFAGFSNNDVNSYSGFLIYDNHSNYNIQNGKPTTIQIINADDKPEIYIRLNGSAILTNLKIYPIIVKGSYTAETMPPFEKHFDGLRDSKVNNIVEKGANLFNINHLQSSKSSDGSVLINNNDGTITLKLANAVSLSSDTLLKDILPNIDITREVIFNYKADGNVTKAFLVYTKPLTIIELNKPILVTQEMLNSHVGFYGGGAYSTRVLSEFICNYGKTALPYSPYTETPHQVPNEIQNLEGYGLGVDSTHYNKIDLVNGTYEFPCKKIVFDGTENWTATGTNAYYVKLNDSNDIRKPVLCNYYIYNNSPYGEVGEVFWGGHQTNKNLIFKTTFTTIEEWKAHLADLYARGNPLTIEYVLQNPKTGTLPVEFKPSFDFKPNGSLTFENEFKQAVPSTTEYFTQSGTLPIKPAIAPDTISMMERDTDEAIFTNSPTKPKHIANKKYVDNSFTITQAQLTQIAQLMEVK